MDRVSKMESFFIKKRWLKKSIAGMRVWVWLGTV